MKSIASPLLPMGGMAALSAYRPIRLWIVCRLHPTSANGGLPPEAMLEVRIATV